MTMKPDTVDDYLAQGCGRCALGGTPECKVHRWPAVLKELRAILRASGLQEEIKWSAPCYAHKGRNVLMLSALRDSVVVSFFQGAQLTDRDGVLEKPGENSRFARYWRFTEAATVASVEARLLAYIREAIAISESGSTTPSDKADTPPMPQELSRRFEEDAEFKAAFEALTPGRQRGYLLHFSSAKQASTRENRIEKCKPAIFKGKGWNER